MEHVLQTAFTFDFAAVAVKTEVEPARYYTSTLFLDPLVIDVGSDQDARRFVPIRSDRIDQLNAVELTRHVIATEGVTFFRDKQPVELSSGQRLFSFIVINILGVIRRDSLILIDEPELFLHPNLEIQLIEMLKKILAQFNSKALLATHSVVTVREMPADCVHVFERTIDRLVVKQPPFQTFGGDVQRITSYVFGDRSVSKPFESWIRAQLQDRGPDAVIASLGDEINEELIVQIRAMGHQEWS